MHLHLDGSNRDSPFVELDDIRTNAKEGFVLAVSRALGNQPLSNVTQITINHGPGSFTGLRISASVANALGYVLGLIDPTSILKPSYGREPNISQIKKL